MPHKAEKLPRLARLVKLQQAQIEAEMAGLLHSRNQVLRQLADMQATEPTDATLNSANYDIWRQQACNLLHARRAHLDQELAGFARALGTSKARHAITEKLAAKQKKRGGR